MRKRIYSSTTAAKIMNTTFIDMPALPWLEIREPTSTKRSRWILRVICLDETSDSGMMD